MEYVKVIGGGLAGCECAYQLAKRGIKVRLYEMKPVKKSPAHHSDRLAEVVCSNSFKGNEISNACGLLKEEMRKLDSLLIRCADQNNVSAGNALAVDRDAFSNAVSQVINSHPNIEVINQVVDHIEDDGITCIATGPLTDEGLFESIKKLTGSEFLHFFDAASPIISKDSIDMESAFFMNRYGKGTPDYLNCPMDKEEYYQFVFELINAKTAQIKDFEEKNVFESCMPIEIMAKRGIETLRFGPLKPVGLNQGDKKHYAVIQLRKESNHNNLYNMVGFQTHLTFGEQKRVFSLISALKNADFVKYGVMHKNTYINSPSLLNADYSMRNHSNIYFLGQISGVEGYVESIASGLIGALSVAARVLNINFSGFEKDTMIGAISNYIATADGKQFQPMNANFGILPTIECRDKKLKKELQAQYALNSLQNTICSYPELFGVD